MFKTGNQLEKGDIFCYLNFNITIGQFLYRSPNYDNHALFKTVEVDGNVRSFWKMLSTEKLYKTFIKKQLYYEET